MEDRRVGRIIREVRVRRAWRQVDLASASHVSQGVVSLIERGRLEDVSLAKVRAVAATLDIAVSLDAWWRSGNADRLVDRVHAALVEHVVGTLRAHGWLTRVEVTFNSFGDRGSADVVAWLPAERILLIVEVKSMIGDVQATTSTFERKVRVLPGSLEEAEGWAPLVVGRLLVLADTHPNRDVVREHRATFDSIWPERTATVRRWLRDARTRGLAGGTEAARGDGATSRTEVGRGAGTTSRTESPRHGFGGIWFVDLDRVATPTARARQVTRVRRPGSSNARP